MADSATISVLLKARDEASGQLRKVEGNMNRLGESFSKHRRGIGMAAAGIGAAITGIGLLSVKSSLDQQIGIDQLDIALKNVGTSYEANKKQIEALASAQQAKTNFGDEEQRKALQSLVQVTGDYDLSMQAMIPLMDMSAATGMKLEGAAILVARAISGEASALKRYGISLDSTAGPQEVLNELMGKFAGQAEAAADPMTQLKNRLGDFMQVFGDMLLPVLEKLLPKIELFIRNIIDWADEHPNLTKVIGLTAAALGGVLAIVGPLLLLLPTLVAGFGLLSIAMGPVTIALVGIAAAVTAGIIIWRNWDRVVGAVKKLLADSAKSWLNYARMILVTAKAIADFIPGLKGTEDKLQSGIDKLDAASGALDDWSGETADATRRAAEAWGAVEDEQMHAAETMIENNEKLGRKTAEVADRIGEKTSEVGRTTQEMAEDMAQAYGDIEDAAFQAQGGIIRSLDEIQKEQDRFTALQRLSIESRISQREKDRQDFMDGVNETIAASQRRRDAEARIEEASDRGLARLRDNLDITNIAWKDSGSKMEDVVRAWSAITGDSIQDVLGRMDELNVDTNNVKATLQTFTSETGQDFLEWSENVKGAAKRAADELKDNAERIRKGGWLTLEQEKLLAGFGGGDSVLGRASQESLDAKAAEKAKQVEAAIDEGMSPTDIATAQRMVAHHVSGHQRLGSQKSVEDLQQNMAEQIVGQINDPHLKEAMQGMITGEIPMAMARGGIVNQPTLAMIGEAGPEAVVPLGRGGGMGTTNNFHFHGAVYGVEDLKEAVVEAVRDHAISGGFSGVFAEA